MIRPVTLLTLLAAMGAGLHLYQTKHAVALLDRELRTMSRQIGEAQERTVALAAEWAWLNEPERLRAVAQKHLSLEPMQPSQFVRIAEAERRLAEAERRLPQPAVQNPVALAVALTVESARVEAPGSAAPGPAPQARVEAAVVAPPRVVARPPPPRPANPPIALVANPPPRSPLLPSSAQAASMPPPPVASALVGGGSLPPPVPFGR